MKKCFWIRLTAIGLVYLALCTNVLGLSGQEIDLFPMGQPQDLLKVPGQEAVWIVQSNGVARLDAASGLLRSVINMPSGTSLKTVTYAGQQQMLVLDRQGKVRLFSLKGEIISTEWSADEGRFMAVAVDTSRRQAYLGDDRGNIAQFDLAKLKSVDHFSVFEEPIKYMLWENDLLSVASTKSKLQFLHANGSKSFGGRLFPTESEPAFLSKTEEWVNLNPHNQVVWWTPQGDRLNVRGPEINGFRSWVPLQSGELAVASDDGVLFFVGEQVVDTFHRGTNRRYSAVAISDREVLVAALPTDTMWRYNYINKEIVQQYVHYRESYKTVGLNSEGKLLSRVGPLIRWFDVELGKVTHSQHGLTRSIDARRTPDLYRLKTLPGWEARTDSLRLLDVRTGEVLWSAYDTLGGALTMNADASMMMQKVANSGFRVTMTKQPDKELYLFPSAYPPGLLPDKRYVWQIGSYPQLNSLIIKDIDAGLKEQYIVPTGRVIHALGSEILARQAQLLYRIDVAQGKELVRFDPMVNKKDPIVALDASEERLAVLDGVEGYRTYLRLYDWNTGRENASFNLESTAYADLFWLPGPNLIALVNAGSGLIEIRNVQDFSIVGWFLLLKNDRDDFVAFTPEGQYDGTKGGLALLHSTARKIAQPGLAAQWFLKE